MVKQAQQQGFCPGSDPRLIAVALVSMLNQFCYTQLSGTAEDVDDAACIKTLADIFYRTIYHREDQPDTATRDHPRVRRARLDHRAAAPAPAAIRARASTTAASGRKPKVAMIATHYQIDFSEHYLADYLATRGIGFLGWNTRFRGFESSFLLDHALVDIGVGVRWLREIAGCGNRDPARQFGRRVTDGRLPGPRRRPARDPAGGHAARRRARRSSRPPTATWPAPPTRAARMC